MRVRLVTIAVVLLLALLGVGCGGGDDEASSDTDTVVTEETLTDETTTDETTTDETTEETTDDDLDLASGECAELVDASSELGEALGATGTDDQADLQDVARLFDELADRAPEEIRADILVLGKAYRAYADVLDDIDVAPGETPDAEAIARLQEALASIDQAEVTAASERLRVWAEENC
jgi:hypothetical protein